MRSGSAKPSLQGPVAIVVAICSGNWCIVLHSYAHPRCAKHRVNTRVYALTRFIRNIWRMCQKGLKIHMAYIDRRRYYSRPSPDLLVCRVEADSERYIADIPDSAMRSAKSNRSDLAK